MQKRLAFLILIIVFLGGLFGTVFSPHSAKAGIFDSFFNLFKPGGSASSTERIAPSVPLYKPAIDYENAVVDAVEKARPSVVSIVVSKDLPVIENCPTDPFQNLPPEFKQFFGQDFPSPGPCQQDSGKTQKQEIGGGSGFIISTDGLVLTNKHVVADTKADYTVLTNDGKKYDAKVLARDPAQDLAILKISASGLTPAVLGDSDSLKLGQTAIAIGNALGQFRNTVSVGVVSGLARTITASGEGFGEETIQGVIQTDAAINPGNSGGPLLNLRGEVIAINTAIVSGAQNIGFAIPINQAKRDVNSVKKNGTIQSPFLGVRYLPVTDDMQKKEKLSVNYGALIRGSEDGPGVIAGSPAQKAGLQAEDIILEVNGTRIDKDTSLSSTIQKFGVGDVLHLKVLRGDKTLTIDVTLAERSGN